VASEKFRPILSERDWFELGVTRLVRSPWLTFTIPTRKHGFVVGLWSAT
jgi:hypothetical protein